MLLEEIKNTDCAFFDSHAHYYDARFAEESAGADVLLGEIFASDVDGIVNVGTSLENAEVVANALEKYCGLIP